MTSTIALLVPACGGEQGPVEGRALEVGAATTYSVTGIAALPPARDVSIMLTRLRNVTSSEVVIRSVEPLGVSVTAEGEAPADILGVELAVRDPSLAETVPLGFYPGPRPALEVDGSCVEQPTIAAERFALEPHAQTADEVYLVVRLRTSAPGTFRLDGQRVVYEAGGTVYRQDFLDGLELEVRDGADPELPAEQLACAAR